jgi:hypothetical protein
MSYFTRKSRMNGFRIGCPSPLIPFSKRSVLGKKRLRNTKRFRLLLQKKTWIATWKQRASISGRELKTEKWRGEQDSEAQPTRCNAIQCSLLLSVLYMFRAVFPLIIRSSKTIHAASVLFRLAVTTHKFDKYRCRMYSF